MSGAGFEVIFFHPNFSDGGVERTNIFLSKAALEDGIAVSFLTTEISDHFKDEVDALGIPVIELGPAPTSRYVMSLARFLTKRAGERNIIFISCQYYVGTISGIVSRLLTKRTRQRIAFVHSERNHPSELIINGGLKNRIVNSLFPILYRSSDAVISNSEETATDLSKILGRPVIAIHNPTINNRLDALKTLPIDETWFPQDGQPFIMGCGRFSHQKGFDVLVDAFAQIATQWSGRLIIAGDGPLKSEIWQRAVAHGLHDRVIFPGHVGNPYKFLARADLFILSSRYEGLPNVLIEALYVGAPCLATACKSGPREILLDGECGLLVPVDDPGAMAAGALTILQTPDGSKPSQSSLSRSLERFHYARVADEFRGFLRGVNKQLF